MDILSYILGKKADGGGGGGGGELSTAKMTVNWNARAGDLIVPVAFYDGEPYSGGSVFNLGSGTYVYDVILNDGIAYLVAGVLGVPSGVNSVQIVGSGDINVLEGGAEADITGDCTISFLVT